MAEMEWDFLEDMRSRRQMICEDFVDRQWQRARERMQAKEDRYARMKPAQKQEEESHQVMSWEEVNISADEGDGQSVGMDDDYQDENIATGQPVSSRGSSRSFETGTSSLDDMPLQFAHLRQSLRKVRPEFYATIDKLKSKYHCSSNQAVAAIIEVGNGMFGREWKYHNEDETCIDLDTAPHVRNIRESGKAISDSLCHQTM